MKNRVKKILSALLICVMAATMIQPAVLPVFAEPEEWVEVDNWDALARALNSGKRVKLMADVQKNDYLTVDAGLVSVLDLNGHTIDRGRTSAGNFGFVVYVHGGDLTIMDSSAGQTGTITGGYNSHAAQGGGVTIDDGGRLTLAGGSISGNTSSGNGGGVYIYDDSCSFIMTGGSITGNTAADNGGGVFVGYKQYYGDQTGCSFTMSGGTISGNTASGNGGGVYVYSAKNAGNVCSFSMSGGTISGNSAANGGGVYLNGSPYVSTPFTMTGGSVTGNTAGTDAGGIYVTTLSTISIGGLITVSGNTCNGAASNLLLASAKYLDISHPVNEASHVGISSVSTPHASSPVRITMGLDSEDVGFLFADNEDYVIDSKAYDDNEAVHVEAALYVATKYSVTVTPPSHGALSADQTQVIAGKTVTLTVTPDPTYGVDHVYYRYNNRDTEVTPENGVYSFQMPSSNVTVRATFVEVPVNVTLEPGEGTGEASTTPVSPSNGTYTYTLPDCPFEAPESKLFDGWDLSGASYQPGADVTLTEDSVFTAQWRSAVIHFDANGGAGVMADALSGASYTLPACGFTAPSGKVFTGWQVGDTVKQPGETISVASDITITAQWSAAYTISKVSGGFKITRKVTDSAETVAYRTVGRSALAGVHFREASGTVTFPANIDSMTVTVNENSASDNLYFYYMGSNSTRTYRFEVLSVSNHEVLAAYSRSIDYADNSRKVPSSGAYSEKTVTIRSAETTVTDDGYDNNSPISYELSNFYSQVAPQKYYQLTGAQLRMVLSFDAKEIQDGYQYLSVLTSTTTYDNRSGCSDGDPGNIRNSLYMLGFEHSKGGKDTTYASYTMPLTNYGNNCSAATSPWSGSPCNNSVGYLSTQKFNTNCRASDGKLILPLNATVLAIRGNASGESDDDWTIKNIKAKIQAFDSTPPVVNTAVVTEGTYGLGDTVTVSLVFSEIVKVDLSANVYLTTNYGKMSYQGGGGTNVLYFSRALDISSTAGNLQITGVTLNGCSDVNSNSCTQTSLSTTTFQNVTYEGYNTIRINHNNGSADSNTVRYRKRTPYVLGEPTCAAPTGKEFDCYQIGNVQYQPGDSFTPTAATTTVDIVWKWQMLPVTFYDEDGTTVLYTGNYQYGLSPEYPDDESVAPAPAKASTAQYDYSLAGWTDGNRTYGLTEALPVVTGEASYTAVYASHLRSYTVTWLNYDDSGLDTDVVDYGETPSYSGAVPTKTFDETYHYAFSGWTPAIASVTGEATYTASFDGVAHVFSEPVYTWTGGEGVWAVSAARNCTVCGCEETEDGTVTGEITTAAGCETPGKTTYTGTFTNEAFATQTRVETDVQALGHDYVAEVTAPTCLEQGYTTHTCSRCDSSYVDTYTDALGHDFGEWTVTTPPTCTDDGAETRYCSRCDATETRTVASLGGGQHHYEDVVTSPTCSEQGYTTHTCSICGHSYKDTYTETPGHNWSEWTRTSEPECEVSGLEIRTCSRCGGEEHRSIAALGHDWSEWGDSTATCTEPGTESHRCSRCGRFEERAVDPLGHDWGEWTTAEPATCEHDGLKTRTCSRCDEIDSDVIDMLPHSWGEITYSWSDGNSCVTASRQCSVCGQTLTKEAYSESEVTVEPGCETYGTTTYTATFVDIGYETQTKSVVDMPPTGHDWGEPTYRWGAENYVAHCTAARVCGNDSSHIESETVDAVTEITTQPTCTEQGVRTHTATFENPAFESQSVTDNIGALGHDWGEWTRTTAQTCTTAGEDIRTCSRCGDTETRTIDAFGHDWEEPVWTWTDEDGSVTATATFTCSRCDASETVDGTVSYTGYYQAYALHDGHYSRHEYFTPVQQGATDLAYSDDISYRYYSFTPAEEGFYRFASTGDLDTYFTLYSDVPDDWTCVAEDDDSGDGYNFSCFIWLEADTEYVLSIGSCSSGEATLTIEYARSHGITMPDSAALHGEAEALELSTGEVSTAANGASVYLRYRAAEGDVVYGVREWIVTNDDTGEAVPVAYDEDYELYYFVMPDAPVTVSASVERMYRCSLQNNNPNMFAAQVEANGIKVSVSGSYEHAYIYAFSGDEIGLFYLASDPHKGLAALNVKTAAGETVAADTPVLADLAGNTCWRAAFTMPAADVTADPKAGRAAYPTLNLGSNDMPASMVPVYYWFSPETSGRYTVTCEGADIMSLNPEIAPVDDNNTYEMGAGGYYIFAWLSDSDAVLTIERTGDAVTYDIAIPTVEHGSVSAAPTSAPPGSTVTLTATPGEGYRSMYVFVKSGGEYLSVSSPNGDEKLTGTPAEYTFTMPEGDVTVEAAFAPRKYRIEFVFDSTSLDTVYLELGETPDARTLEMEFWDASAYFGAPFIGWEPEIGPVTGDTVYTMVYGEESPEWYHVYTTDEAITASLFISPPLGRGVTDSNTHAGLKVVLSAAVEDGKGVESWSVVDADGNSIALDTDEYGFPCFTMPESDVTVSATYTDNVLPVHLLDGCEYLVGSDVNGALRTSLTGTSGDPYAAPDETVTLLFFDDSETGVTVTVTPKAGEPFTVSGVPAPTVVMDMHFSIISFTMPDSPVSISADQQSHMDLPELALGTNEIDNRKMWYSFTPAKTGVYSFKALDNNTWRAYVYDEDGNEVDRFSSDSPAATLVAGERCLLQFDVNSYSLSLTYIMIEEPSEEAVLYPITVEEVLHGRVVPTVDEAPEGYQVTLTLIPDPGYSLSDISPEVTCSGVSLDLVACNRDRYYFDMPAGAVTVVPPEFVPVDYALTVEAAMGTATALVNGEPAETAHCGDTVVLEMEPADSSFAVPNVYVNGVRLKAQDGVYSFTMPAEGVSISVVFRDAEYYNVHIAQSAHGTIGARWEAPGRYGACGSGGTPVDSLINVFAADVEDGWAVVSLNVYTADGPITPENGKYTMPAEDIWIEADFSEAQKVSFLMDPKAVRPSQIENYWQWSSGAVWTTETEGYAVPGSEVIVPVTRALPATGRIPVFSVATASGETVPFHAVDVTFKNYSCTSIAFTMPDEPVVVTIDAAPMDMEALELGENHLTLAAGETYYTFTPEESGVYRITNTGGYLPSMMTWEDTGVLGGNSRARLVGGETYIQPVGRVAEMPAEVIVTITRVGDIETNTLTIADDIEYGTVEATVSEAPAGYYVQLKAIPDNCSELVSIRASWEGGDIELGQVTGEDLTFDFAMPSGAVTVTAEFSAPAHFWEDLPEWTWAEDCSAASAVLVCRLCGERLGPVEAEITIDGCCYVARAVFGNAEDTDLRVIVPVADTGLVYDGEVRTGVEYAENGKNYYTLSGNTAKDAGSYTATATLLEGRSWADGTAEPKQIAWSIAKAATPAPTGLSGVAETMSGKADGQITGVPDDSPTEYRKEGETAYTAVTAPPISGLSAGTYYVRYAETNNNEASPETAVVIGAGRTLTVTFVDEDGTTLQSDVLDFGDTPEYRSETPVKASDAENHYTFSVWTPEIAPVSGDAVYTAVYTAAAHNWSDWTVVKEPTEDEDGVEQRVCSTVPSHVETRTIPKLSHIHTLVKVAAVAPTCTEAGSSAYYVCEGDDGCGLYFSDADGTQQIELNSVVIAALGHRYVTSVTAPTCTGRGYTTHTCTACGDSYVDTYVDALGHNYGSVVTAPTCTERGYTTHTCTVCGDSYVDTYVDALGHIWREPVWIWAEDGSSATATFTCVLDSGHTETLDATVTIDGNDRTASVTFNGTTYTTDAEYTLALELGTNTISHPGEGRGVTYTFTPAESGWYSFTASAQGYPNLTVYDSAIHAIASDQGEDGIAVYAKLEAGETYRVVLCLASACEGAIDVTKLEAYSITKTGGVETFMYEGVPVTSAPAGATIYLTIGDTPAGYWLSGVIAMAGDQEIPIEMGFISIGGFGGPNFTMPASDVIVSAEYLPQQELLIDLTAGEPSDEVCQSAWSAIYDAAYDTIRETGSYTDGNVSIRATSEHYDQFTFFVDNVAVVVMYNTFTDMGPVWHIVPAETAGDLEALELSFNGTQYSPLVFKLKNGCETHDWEFRGFSWTGYTAAEATFVCRNDNSHVHAERADISVDRVEPTRLESGLATYTAVVSFEGRDYSETKTVVLPRLDWVTRTMTDEAADKSVEVEIDTATGDVKVVEGVTAAEPVMVAWYDENGMFIGFSFVKTADTTVTALEGASEVLVTWIDSGFAPKDGAASTAIGQ